ncbi:MAG: S8 family serine peptidase [Methanocellales archaeon]|nr:S8 family serine peptidase [Methanocellales archaeon]
MVLAFITSLFLVSASARPANIEKVPVIIGFKDKPDPALIRAHGGDIKYKYHVIPAIAASMSPQACDAMMKNKNVAYIEPDHEVHALQQTLPWGVDRIDANLVWSYNKGTGVKVAIIDTGIDYTHPDLDANYRGGYDFVNDDADPKDDNGHGTHCAGIVVAEDNDIGVVGVAPEASLYAVKVLDRLGSGWLSDVIAGIQWSVDNDMDVVSMSLGTSTYSASLETACNNAYNAGLVLVAAAGNSGDGNPATNEYSYPAAYGSVIAVGATDINNVAPSWSNSGPYLELAAPGVRIYSTLPTYRVTLTRTYGYDYGTLSGTSMACPHAAGVAALVMASDPTLTNTDVRSRLQTTADDLGPVGWDSVYGYGLVDADEAAPGVDTIPPTISDITPADGAFVNTGTPTISATVTDASGIDATSIVMMVDGATVAHTYDSATGLVSYVSATPLVEGLHTATLDVSDTVGNLATASWSFTVDTTPPAQVTGLVVTTVSSSQLDLSWYANTETDLDHYNVYRSTTSGSPYDLVASPTTNSYSDTGLVASTTYYYTVTAVDTAGNEGIPSEEASGTTSEAPANLMHVASIDMWYTRVGWNYKIYTKVMIVDSGDLAVEGATVYLEMALNGNFIASGSGDTGAEGTVTFVYGPTRTTGAYTSTVTDVVKLDWTYDSPSNLETSEKLVVP